MAEGFELVRTVRQHLRRGAALLDEGKLDDALAEVNAALALDAQSLPAQALRDRIDRAKHLPAQQHVQAPPATSPAKSSSFVPHGVNAASWRGFEQRIQERRFRALLDTINTSIVSGDAATARVALEEARELRPDAPELATFESRVAAVPAPVPSIESKPGSRIWIRAMGAAAMLVIGVSMLLGLEWLRPSPPIATTAPAVQSAPVLVPAGAVRVPPPAAQPVPVDVDEDDSVPAIVTPPEPTLRPRGTTGMTTPTIDARDPRPIAVREMNVAPPVLTHPIDTRRAVLEEPVRPVGEVPDDYVTTPSPATRTAAVTEPARTAPARTAPIDVARPPVQTANIPASVDTPVPATPQPTAASVVPAAAAISPREESRVEEVLRRYARAYGALDASAAAAVWPTVDEKALARAFKDLSSQNVSFDDCEIDIRGAVANASCRGQASYVGKVGSREPRTESRTWRFELRRDGEAWKIENAEARRTAAASTNYR